MNAVSPARTPDIVELYRSDTVLVRQVGGDDERHWVITFDHHSIGEGFDRLGFGEDFLFANGISAIHVLGRGDDWYQYDDVFDALATVKAATAGAERRITYGSSMGGYAAVRFADAVAADGVLALSPQWSINPAKAPWEDRWPQDSHRIAWNDRIDGAVRCRTTPILVYDPCMPLDHRHATRIAAETQSVLLPVSYSGHPSSTFLGEVRLLRTLLEDILQDRFDKATTIAAVRARRATSSVYLGTLAEHQPAVRPRTALALARAAHAAQPGRTLGMLSLARMLTRSDHHSEAIALHRRIAILTGRLPIYLVPFADALWAAGDTGEALEIAQEVVAALPGTAHLRNWYSSALWKAGRHRAAIEQQQFAVRLAPQNRRYRRRLILHRIARSGWWLRRLISPVSR